MIIEILDAVDCRVVAATKEEKNWLKQLLSYNASFYRKKQFGGESKHYIKSLFKYGTFPAGFIPRIINAAKTDGVQITTSNKISLLEIQQTNKEPSIPGITLRPDQLMIVSSVASRKRGVILSPTGSGKTVCMMGILSLYPKEKALVVLHTQDLLVQTLQVFKKHGIEAAKLGDKTTTIDPQARLLVATKQSLIESYTTEHKGKEVKCMRVKGRHKEWFIDLDVILIDEVHLFGGLNGQYAALLRSSPAPIRIGFTGTLPDSKTEMGMALEGLLGPVLASITYDQAKKLDILSPIKLELLCVPYQKTIGALTTYRDIYRKGIVHNRTRNKIIMERVLKSANQGLTTLVFVEAIEHGEALHTMALLLGVAAVFINGSDWEATERNEIKQQLTTKKLLCVICTKVWREGIDIPNLNSVILAGGGKAELSTLQTVGRGLRTAPGKDYAVIIDLLDPYDFVAKHTIQRLGIYKEKGWL